MKPKDTALFVLGFRGEVKDDVGCWEYTIKDEKNNIIFKNNGKVLYTSERWVEYRRFHQIDDALKLNSVHWEALYQGLLGMKGINCRLFIEGNSKVVKQLNKRTKRNKTQDGYRKLCLPLLRDKIRVTGYTTRKLLGLQGNVKWKKH